MKKIMMIIVMIVGSVMSFADDGTHAKIDFNKTISEASSVIKLIDSKMIKVNSGTGYGMIAVIVTTMKIDHCKYIMICRTNTSNETSSTIIHAQDCEYCRGSKK